MRPSTLVEHGGSGNGNAYPISCGVEQMEEVATAQVLMKRSWATNTHLRARNLGRPDNKLHTSKYNWHSDRRNESNAYAGASCGG